MPDASTGPRVSPNNVSTYANAALYDQNVVRTLFLDFENADWQQELADFHNTDVDVTATLRVDGRSYPLVGVHVRGMSSYMMVPAGHKRSFNVSLDLVDTAQRLIGRKTLNLLNSNGDASFLSTVLYSNIAREYLPAPRANHVQVVVNGESWGLYVNVEQFDNDFVVEHFNSARATTAGARWKVPGSPMGRGGLDYLGDSVAPYKERYDLKTRSRSEDWQALISLTKVLGTTPLDKLEAALAPILDIEGALRFLALDVVLMNSDGYWTRASDYSIYRDLAGVMHLVPHDMNEAFRSEAFPGRFGGPPGFPWPQAGAPGSPGAPQPSGEARPQARAENFALDPLVAVDDPLKPLRSRLLAVPALRQRYLVLVRTIAERSLAWQSMGPVVAAERELLTPFVRADTRKNSSIEAFLEATADTPSGALRRFFEERRRYLMEYRPSGAD